jgi:hypothetical protein
LGLVIMVFLVIRGVKLNSKPPINQWKIHKILVHVQYQEKSKGIKNMLRLTSNKFRILKV